MQTPLPDELNVLPVYRNVPSKNAAKYENSEWMPRNYNMYQFDKNNE